MGTYRSRTGVRDMAPSALVDDGENQFSGDDDSDGTVYDAAVMKSKTK